MDRRAKAKKANAGAKRPLVRKPPDDGAKVRDLEERLAKALEREAEAVKREAEAQEQQAPTAEILRVISSSQNEVQPVFDSIVRSAVRLLDGPSANVLRVSGDQLQLAAMTAVSEASDAETRATFPIGLTAAGVA